LAHEVLNERLGQKSIVCALSFADVWGFALSSSCQRKAIEIKNAEIKSLITLEVK
jgi:hypothetical protein